MCIYKENIGSGSLVDGESLEEDLSGLAQLRLLLFYHFRQYLFLILEFLQLVLDQFLHVLQRLVLLLLLVERCLLT